MGNKSSRIHQQIMSLSIENLKRYHEIAFGELESLNTKYSKQMETKKTKRQKIENEIEKLNNEIEKLNNEIDTLNKTCKQISTVLNSKKTTQDEERWNAFYKTYQTHNFHSEWYDSSKKIQNSYFRLSKKQIDEIRDICIEANMIFNKKCGKGEFRFISSNNELYRKTYNDISSKIKKVVSNYSIVSIYCVGRKEFAISLSRKGPPLSDSGIRSFDKKMTYRYNTRWHIYLQNELFTGVDQNLKNRIIEMGKLPCKKNSWKIVHYY